MWKTVGVALLSPLSLLLGMSWHSVLHAGSCCSASCFCLAVKSLRLTLVLDVEWTDVQIQLRLMWSLLFFKLLVSMLARYGRTFTLLYHAETLFHFLLFCLGFERQNLPGLKAGSSSQSKGTWRCCPPFHSLFILVWTVKDAGFPYRYTTLDSSTWALNQGTF